MKQINFIPKKILQKQELQGLLIKCSVLVLGGLLIIGFWGVYKSRQVGLISRRIESVNQDLESARTRSDQLIVLAKNRRKELSKHEIIHEKLEPAVPATSVIALVERLMPRVMGLTSFSLIGEPIQPNIASRGRPGGKSSDGQSIPLRLSLEGMAPNDLSIARFIGRLDKSKLFENVEMSFSRPMKNGSLLGRTFRVTANIPLDREFVVESKQKVSHAH